MNKVLLSMTFPYSLSGCMVIGSGGGHSIINYVALTLVNVLDWNMDIQKAIDAPRTDRRNGPTELKQGTPLERLTPELERRVDYRIINGDLWTTYEISLPI